VTNNSGASWSLVTPNVNFGDSIRDMDFVSTTTGWMLDADLNGNTALYRTMDGGSTWTLLFSNMPPPTPLPPPTATPVTLMGPYAVAYVAPNDVLNIRAGAGVSEPVIGYYPPDATDVMRTGPATTADGAAWVEIRRADGLTGWVNSFYLTEYLTHEAFCADTRILPMIEQLKQSMNQSNGDLLSTLVSPVHGTNMHLWAYGTGINFTQTTSKHIFTNTTSYNWGGGPSGIPDVGTFKDIVQPKYLEVFNASNQETYCDDLTKVFPLSNPWPYQNIRFYNLYKPASDKFFDFRTLLIGVEYIDNQPYMTGMVTIVWEP
jgi:hypothetical protein